MTTLDESLILTLMCGIKVCDYIRWKPDIDINVWYKGLWLHEKPDIDINVSYKGLWLH